MTIDVPPASRDAIQAVFDDPRVFAIYLVVGGEGTKAGDLAGGMEDDLNGVSAIRFLTAADAATWMQDQNAAAEVVGKPRTKRKSLTADQATDRIAVYATIDDVRGS